jgi:transcriptional regulator with XRE-family HTH domain
VDECRSWKLKGSTRSHFRPGIVGELIMSGKTRISGRLIAAARGLTGISQAEFAAAAGLPVEALSLMEAGGSAWLPSELDVEAVSRGFQHYGVILIEESGGMGAGVRLKFTRQDVRQIARLEGEGGIIGSDDAP